MSGIIKLFMGVQLKVIGVIIKGLSERTQWSSECPFIRSWKKPKVGLRKHEEQRQKGVIGFIQFQLRYYRVAKKVLSNVTEQRSVMIREIPTPGWQSFVVVPAIKIKSLNVLYYDVSKLLRVVPVLNPKPTLVVNIHSFDYLIIFNLKLVQLSL